jgi:hypothetical protein
MILFLFSSIVNVNDFTLTTDVVHISIANNISTMDSDDRNTTSRQANLLEQTSSSALNSANDFVVSDI